MTKAIELKGIGGWLAFFIFSLIMSAIWTFVAGVEDISYILSEPLLSPFTKLWLLTLDSVLFFGMIGFIIYTIYALSMIKPNAVALAKMTLILSFVANLLGVVFTSISRVEVESIISENFVIRGLIFSVIWFLYLVSSKRIKNTYPPEKRVVYTIDKLLFFLIIAIPLVIYFLAFMSLIYEQSSAELPGTPPKLQRILATNELTDGRIYFVLPQGWTADKEYVGIVPVFVLTKGDEMSFTIISDSGKYNSEEYFKESFDTAFASLKGDLELDYEVFKEIKIDENYIERFNKALLIHGEEDFIWGTTILFDNNSDKIAIISYFTPERTYYELEKTRTDLINLLKFA